MMWKLQTFQARIFATITALMAFMSLGMGIVMVQQQTSSLQRELINRGELISRHLAYGSVLSLLVRDETGLHELLKKVLQEQDVVYAEVYDRTGALIASVFSGGRQGAVAYDGDKEVDTQPLAEKHTWVKAEFRGEKIYEFRVPVIDRSSESGELLVFGEESQAVETVLGQVHVGIGTLRIEAAKKHAIQTGLIILLLLMFVALLVGWLLSRSLSRPLSRMNKVIDEIRDGASDRRIQLSGHDEVARVAQAFDAMLDALTEREVALEAERITTRAILDHASESIILLDHSGNVLATNPSASKLFGYSGEEWSKLSVHDLVPEEVHVHHIRWFSEEVNEGKHNIFGRLREVRARRKDGSTFPCEVSVSRFELENSPRMSVFLRDLTEQKQEEEERQRTQQQMEHVQRLESLGVLAGGIAHDFNNILGAIMGNAALAERKILDDPLGGKEYLSKIVSSSEKAALLCKQMLAYSGKGQFVIQSIDLSAMVKSITSLLEVSINRGIVLKYHLAKQLPLIEADESQIQQIIMNLVINASEAIDDNSGVISVSTGMMYADNSYLSSAVSSDPNIEVREGRYVFLEVSDTGCGVDKQTQLRIFEPFFTTKFTGRGLGMSAILGIVRGHHGAIHLYSEKGQGTTFKILFPISEHDETFTMPEADRADISWHPSGTILVVDDEETIRETAAMMLEDMGFKTLLAGDGLEGVALYREHQNDIVAVLLDMTMPKLDGVGCFRELRRINRNVKVILSSGYSEQEATGRFSGKGLAGFIQKPYLPNLLEETLKRILP